MRIEFSGPSRIIFGEGTISEAASLATSLGKRALLVTGGGKNTTARIQAVLAQGIPVCTLFQVDREPTVDLIIAGVQLARSCGAELVVGCGGGSAIDTAKAVGCLANNPGEVLDYLEVVGNGREIGMPGIPVIAVPTTAGTGSEVTRNAVLSAPEKKMKVSLRSPYVLPRYAVIDPELTYSLPPAITASTGMDALTQVIEPFVSIRANPMADLFCREGMGRIGRSLLRAYQNGSDTAARGDMSWGSLMGGLALANAGLGAVHGFASPIGGMFQVSHGIICARLLTPCIQMNLRVLKKHYPESAIISRYDEAARIILGSTAATPQSLVDWLVQISQELRIPRLGEVGISRNDFTKIIENAKTASSMKANPVVLNSEELLEILEMAL
jgi:alcohol dehydrogenase class IV